MLDYKAATGEQLKLHRKTATVSAELADGDLLCMVDEEKLAAKDESLKFKGNPCAYRVLIERATLAQRAAPVRAIVV